jgi:3-oxoacyl-[acyl-carrier protein] reductase
MDLVLKGKKALVMGSSSGIGRAIAESLIAEGVSVAISARNETKLKLAAQQMGANIALACDYSVPGETRSLVKKTNEALGGIDILVTNTGGPARGNFLEITEKQWVDDYQSVWMSTIEAMHEALPHMQKQKYGRVLFIASVSAREPLPRLTSSNGLRSGLRGLAKSIATEYASFGVNVNLIMPGYTNTERLKELNLTEERIKQMIPAGRLAEPKEIADFVTFLASPKASYITGQAIAVDGGFMKGN